METQHTAYRQIGSVFGIAPISNADFGTITPNNFNIWSQWVESVWKNNTQHIANLVQYLGLRQSQILILEA